MRRFIHTMRSLVRRSFRGRSREEFENLFLRFRRIMESNTRSLEVITEMGDILGGDYLFDIQYVTRAHEGLASLIEESLGQFDELTGGEYPELLGRFQEIDSTISDLMAGNIGAGSALVVAMESEGTATSMMVGGKMAPLIDLRRSLRLAVPEGFIVTTQGFNEYLRHNRIFENVSLPKDGRPLSDPVIEELSEEIMHGEMPPLLHTALERALKRFLSRCRGACSLAVRSSADSEDGDHAFAGQYRTVLNVPPDIRSLELAYRKVIASLFTSSAAVYQQRFGYDPTRIRMAVGCLAMVDAVSSGVLYTANPAGPDGTMAINASWGLGTAVVDGIVDADQFIVDRSGKIIDQHIGGKAVMMLRQSGAGISEAPTPVAMRNKPSLSPEQAGELVRAGALLEGHFRMPQDIEWAFDDTGRLIILQSRPLRLPASPGTITAADRKADAPKIQFRDAGIVVQRGAASGPVYVVKQDRQLGEVPAGAVLVVKHDSPNLTRVMATVAAIITDAGSLTSHLASLAREFRVPTLVNTGDASRILEGQREVTVALDDLPVVYAGRVGGLAGKGSAPSQDVDDLFEFRRKRALLRYIAPLNLVDPFRDDFSPKGCRTLHDILRFMHEKAVAALVDAAGFGRRSPGAVKLELSIPAGITVIDIGGGLETLKNAGSAAQEDIASLPFKALIRGMVYPGAWRSEAVPLSVNDFLTSMFRAPDLNAESDRQAGANIAILSKEYVNLHIKFGYHYTILDSYVSDTPRSNHIYFRFAGGATDVTKRSRRLQVIAALLESDGFAINTKGDMIIARLSNRTREDMMAVLERVGRLVSFTRQLDAVLQDDDDVTKYTEHFLRGEYELTDRAAQR